MLANLEAAPVFKYFEIISKIPRESGNEKAISDYLVNFAKENNLEFDRDEVNNVLIKKQATNGYENAPTIILQAHVDMVCVKAENSKHDFSKDPIELVIDGDIIKAKDTSLGADDGMGVAIILAVLAEKNIAHPRIEALLTVDEERTMLGAEKFDLNKLSGKILFSLDGEIENTFTAGSCGSTNLNIIYDIKQEKNIFPAYEIKIDGLLGGHSGIEIVNERANAIVLLARFLYELKSEFNFSLIEITGGSRSNVIPSDSSAIIAFEEKNFDAIKNNIHEISQEFQSEFKISEPNINITIKKLDKNFDLAISNRNLDCLLKAILLIPNGLINRNLALDNAAETSNNIGKINFDKNKKDKIVINSMFRSSMISRTKFFLSQIKAITEILSRVSDTKIEILSEHPAWDYNPNSKIISFCKKIYEQIYSASPKIEATHGGLECSYFKQIPDIDIIDLGPNIDNNHSVNETVEISSVNRFWIFFKKVLSELKNFN